MGNPELDTNARCVVTAALAASALTTGAGAGVIVNSWTLSCFVRDGNGNTNGVALQTIENPFDRQHQAGLGISTAAASYHASFGASGLDFRTTNSLAAAGNQVPLHTLDSACTGSIHLATDSDFLLTADMTFAYALASGDREAYYHVAVVRASPNTTFWVSDGLAEPVFGDPASFTWMDHATSVLLPGGAQYGLSYVFELSSIGGDPSVLSHGNASLHLALQPVPEPGTALLASIAGLCLCRRAWLQRPGR